MESDYKWNDDNAYNDAVKKFKEPSDNKPMKGKRPKDSYSYEDDSNSNNNNSSAASVNYIRLYRFATNKDKIRMIIAITCSLVTGCVPATNTFIFSKLTQAMVDYELGGDETKFDKEITLFAIRCVSLGTIFFVFSYLSTMLSNYSAHNQVFTIRKEFLKAALNQDISYYDLNESGDFAIRMTDDLSKIEDAIGEKLTTFLHYLVAFLACVTLAFTRGWELTLVSMAIFPVTLITLSFVGITSTRLAKQESQAYGVAGAVAEEVLGGIRTVLAFGGQQKEVDRYKQNLVAAKDINIRRNTFTGIGLGFLFFCIYSTYALSFWYGVNLVIDRKDDYPVQVMVNVLFGVLLGNMNLGMATPLIETFGMGKGAAAKLFSVIDNEPVIDPQADRGHKPKECNGDISFENVFFNYPSRPDVNILQGLDLNINSGQTVAIVGGSGCGKSTCIQLVQRFYDPLQGIIKLDGNDIKNLSVNWLRSNIGVVGQEPVLFNTTIAENIRYGYEKATKDEIEKAAKQSNAHTFIKMLPKGYDTLVGERGTQLSGGQKQRIAIARALIRNPKILLLDEATSALDNTSERKVQEALDKAGEGRTTIIVAHRLSTIRTADVIIALHDGKVAEQGSHEQLMSLKGHYYNLVMSQVGPLDKNDPSTMSADRKNALRRTSTISAKSNKDDDDDDDIIKILQTDGDNENSEDIPILSLWTVAGLNKPEWKIVLAACLGSFLMGSASPTFSVIFGEIIGTFAGPVDKMIDTVNFYAIVFVVAGIILFFANFFSIFLFGIAGERMTMRLRGETFEAMLKQEIGWYDDKANATGALCARLSGEASAVQGATGQRIGTIIQSMATLVLAISLSIYFEWRLGLVAVSFMPITLGVTMLHKRILLSENFGSSKAMERSTKLAVEVISNIRTVVSLGGEKMFIMQFITELDGAMVKAKRNTHFRGIVFGVARAVLFYALAASMYYGGYLIINKDVAFKNVLRVSQALLLATQSVANALTFAPNMEKGLISASRILHLLARRPKITDPAIPDKMEQKGDGEVKYVDVDFAYPTRPYIKVLRKLGLIIEPGKTVALVGASGCGKSTCIQLLERFYDPMNGKVLLNNKPIDSVTLQDLRSNLGIVSQEPILFDRTIGQNIAYGDNSRSVTEQEIIQAARKANIHNFITSLPNGYETRLGSKGAQLSGGQKQRVAIARALLRDPKVLLLDEATSALDTESEKIVQEALDKAKVGRTCITIAHRLTTIKDADLICVFNEGCISESGTHSQLMEKKGLYYRLQIQSSKAV